MNKGWSMADHEANGWSLSGVEEDEPSRNEKQIGKYVGRKRRPGAGREEPRKATKREPEVMEGIEAMKDLLCEVLVDSGLSEQVAKANRWVTSNGARCVGDLQHFRHEIEDDMNLRPCDARRFRECLGCKVDQ